MARSCLAAIVLCCIGMAVRAQDRAAEPDDALFVRLEAQSEF